jgi:lactoylglutathione lyase
VQASELYHAGVVVDDLVAAREQLTAAGGYSWTAVVESDVPVQFADGERVVTLRVCFSTASPHLELIQAVPGTVWEPPSSGVHHLGYWSDDVAADCADLEAKGYAVEAWSDLGGLRMFAYCWSPLGPRVELVHRSFAPVLRSWVADASEG